ncbi:MAG: sulfite exporter TauE/SafE family protein [Alphaproteobacteria bacterium]
MASLSALGLAFYALVLVGAFAVRGAAGFGAGLIAVPLLAFILPVPTAVAVATVLTMITSARQVGRDWGLIAWGQFFLVSFYTVIGIGLAFYFIKTLDEHALRRGLAGFLILYSLYALWTRGSSPVLPTRWHGALAAGAGVSGGFFGALFGGGVGPIYVVYFNVVRLNREVFRVTMSMIMLVSVAIRITGYASFGFYGRSALTLLALGLPLVFVGSWLGDRIARRLDPRRFGALVGGLVLLSGVALLLR